MAMNSSIERLATRLGIGSGSRRIGRTTLVRLTAYYVVVLAVIAGFIVITDNMRALHVTAVRGSAPHTGTIVSDAAEPADAPDLTRHLWGPLFRALPPLGTGAAAVLSAFLLAVPIAFTYVRTRSSLKYDQSLVQTVIMLPVVVTSILIVVANSLALAFSLAGIVAAVRFRNNLKDTRDAVYVFASIGIGFAAGVGALAIAAFLSVFFSVLELLLWKLDLTADHEHTFGLLCMPASASASPAHGETITLPPNPPVAPALPADASSSTPSADTGLLALGGGKPEPSDAGGAGAGKKSAERLLVYSSDPDKARKLADSVLAEMAKEFKHKRTRNGGNDRYVLEYRVRARKKTPVLAIIDRLYAEGVPYVIAAEVVPGDSEAPETT
jgi:Domain of unknown function (DUF4956)